MAFNFKAAGTLHTDLGAKENKICHCFHFFFPSICHGVMELDAMILAVLMLSFKTAFSLSSFTLLKRLLSLEKGTATHSSILD